MNKDKNKTQQVHTRTLHTTKTQLREVTSIIDDGLLNAQVVVDLLREKSIEQKTQEKQWLLHSIFPINTL